MSLVNHRGTVNALAFNQDGHLLATAGDDGVVRIVKIAEGQAPRVMPDSPGNRGEPIKRKFFSIENLCN
jgi:WD40 repeat protein